MHCTLITTAQWKKQRLHLTKCVSRGGKMRRGQDGARRRTSDAHDCLVNKRIFRAISRDAKNSNEIRVCCVRKIFVADCLLRRKSHRAMEARAKTHPGEAIYPSKIFFTGWCLRACFRVPDHSHSLESGFGDSACEGHAGVTDGARVMILVGEKRCAPNFMLHRRLRIRRPQRSRAPRASAGDATKIRVQVCA